MLASAWVPSHEYRSSLKLISELLLQIKTISIPRLLHCLWGNKKCVLILTQSTTVHIYKMVLSTPGTGCLQKSLWNSGCQSWLLDFWHEITTGKNFSPMLSFQSRGSLFINRRCHTVLPGLTLPFFLDFSWTKSCKQPTSPFLSLEILRLARKK